MSRSVRLDPKRCSAYAQGVFPMADRDGVIRLYTADPRGVIPLDGERSTSPARSGNVVRQGGFEIRINSRFRADHARLHRAARGTARGSTTSSSPPTPRSTSWASPTASRRGRTANSSAACTASASAAAFFGESMFHRQRDASKVALVHLVDRLRERGYELLDTQATTSHLRRFGCIDIPAAQYMAMLERAMQKECTFA